MALGLLGRHRAVKQYDDVRILLDGARFAQVRELWALAGATLDLTRQLRERNDGHTEVLGHNLDATAHLGDLRSAAVRATLARRRRDELQVVENDEAVLLAVEHAACLGADLRHRGAGGVVDHDVEQRQVVGCLK